MRKYTKLMAFLLSLALFAVTPISVLATDGTDQGSTDNPDNTENPDGPDEPVDPDGTGDGGGTGDTGNTGNQGGGGAAAGDYAYKIRIYAGNKGSFLGEENSDVIKYDNVSETPQLGKTCKIKLDDEKLADGQYKYYVRGIRVSGRDNDTVPAGATATPTGEDGVYVVNIGIPVDSDMDYVVAYGIRGKMVKYTVTYKDAAGNELYTAQTFEGKIGDFQIVPYQYIDGYRPNAYTYGKTLDEDPSKNVFPFVYERVTAPNGGTIGEGGETVTYVDNGTTVITNPAAGGGGTTVIDGGTTVIPGGGAGGAAGAGDAADGGAGTEVIADEQTPLGEPEQMINLDDEDVPLAEGNGIFGLDGDANLLGIPLPVIGVIVLVIALGLGFAFMFLKKKKKETES